MWARGTSERRGRQGGGGFLRPPLRCRRGACCYWIHTSFAAVAPAQPAPPVALGLDPRAHSAAAPSLSRKVRNLMRTWIAGTSQAMKVRVRSLTEMRTEQERGETWGHG